MSLPSRSPIRRRLRSCLALAVFAVALGTPANASAAFDTFLKLDGIQGDAQAVGFENQIEVFSFSWGMTGKSPRQDKPASFSSLNLMKRADVATVDLIQRAATGATIPRAVVTLRRAGGDGESFSFMRYCFDAVSVESVQHSGSSGGDQTPTESVSLRYGTFTVGHKADPQAGFESFSWDLTRAIQYGPATC